MLWASLSVRRSSIALADGRCIQGLELFLKAAVEDDHLPENLHRVALVQGDESVCDGMQSGLLAAVGRSSIGGRLLGWW